MNKVLSFSIVAILMAVSVLALAGRGFTVYAAHTKANSVLVQIGDYCSGIVIDNVKGYVTTAGHCTEAFTKYAISHKETYSGKNAVVIVKQSLKQKLTRRVISPTGKIIETYEYDAVLIGEDRATDVAILQVVTNLKNLPGRAIISRTPVAYGDEVFTMGNPNDELGSVGKGTVENPNVNFDSDHSYYTHMIRHNAYISQGSSGGGLFDYHGQLVGVTNWTSNGGTFLASPISNVIKLMKKLKL